ncbi:jg22462 [Pararge aegeria aegeria]|uniref:Jg22462 protein n=2 Tax=Pararge aegeria TaxID=116150 RepID=A0A8S4SI48_9NEOP|nr:jg22462 [Pararge aegeria aegeria]
MILGLAHESLQGLSNSRHRHCPDEVGSSINTFDMDSYPTDPYMVDTMQYYDELRPMPYGFVMESDGFPHNGPVKVGGRKENKNLLVLTRMSPDEYKPRIRFG